MLRLMRLPLNGTPFASSPRRQPDSMRLAGSMSAQTMGLEQRLDLVNPSLQWRNQVQ